MLVELDGEDMPAGQDRHRVVALAWVLGLALLSTVVGLDRPRAIVLFDALAPAASANSLRLEVGDLVFYRFPIQVEDAPPPVNWMEVRVRSTQGLAFEPARPGELAVLTWTERGVGYWLSSPIRTVSDLISVADGLR